MLVARGIRPDQVSIGGTSSATEAPHLEDCQIISHTKYNEREDKQRRGGAVSDSVRSSIDGTESMGLGSATSSFDLSTVVRRLDDSAVSQEDEV